ncbi:LOW QUALITY PROTEIN: PHO23 Transcriptional regulatory protein PHO23 [Candida maltosa Xu316]
MTNLPPREKPHRAMKQQQQDDSSINSKNFQLYKSPAKIINSINELLPGLNDISDAFEALPLDLIKYFTLLKEIDAKCINTIPQINTSYIGNLHEEKKTPTPNPEQEQEESTSNTEANGTKSRETRQLNLIRNKINEIIPCLEEKMHVTSVASDLLNKHMLRINQDYKLIIMNNEIPESIRIGPLNHPAMINDSHNSNSANNNSSSAQSQRSESRREALAARKANKEDDAGGNNYSNSYGKQKKKKENSPNSANESKNASVGSGNGASKKRSREDGNRSGNGGNSSNSKKKKKPQHDYGDDEDEDSTDVSVTGSQNRKVGDGNTNKAKASTNNSNASGNTRGAGSGSSGGGAAGNNSNTNTHGNAHGNSSSNEPTYCYCNQVSFGEMVGCDGDDCKREWFHLPCIGFKNPPKGKWYCDDCLAKMKKMKKV